MIRLIAITFILIGCESIPLHKQKTQEAPSGISKRCLQGWTYYREKGIEQVSLAPVIGPDGEFVRCNK